MSCLLGTAFLLVALNMCGQSPASDPSAPVPSSDQSTNEANNPLTPKITVNFHDYWGAQLYGTKEGTNAFLFVASSPINSSGCRKSSATLFPQKLCRMWVEQRRVWVT